MIVNTKHVSVSYIHTHEYRGPYPKELYGSIAAAAASSTRASRRGEARTHAQSQVSAFVVVVGGINAAWVSSQLINQLSTVCASCIAFLSCSYRWSKSLSALVSLETAAWGRGELNGGIRSWIMKRFASCWSWSCSVTPSWSKWLADCVMSGVCGRDWHAE